MKPAAQKHWYEPSVLLQFVLGPQEDAGVAHSLASTHVAGAPIVVVPE
jgi:hypothetical protein